jgi:hypothetical protein
MTFQFTSVPRIQVNLAARLLEWERHGGLTLVRIKRVIGIECKTVLLKEVEIRLVNPETPLCGSLADLLPLCLIHT